MSGWQDWIPTTPLAKWMQLKFAERDLWEQEELFATFPEIEGVTRNDFFREEMYDNEDWPWTTFKAESKDTGLKPGHRYLRRRASWKPVFIDAHSEDPCVSSGKNVLTLIETALTYAPMLSHHNKHSSIVTGILIRLRDRVRNELERFQQDTRWGTP